MFEACINITLDANYTLFSRRKAKARKKHKCIECRCTIEPGDIYEKDVTVCKGKFETFKTCSICARIRDTLFMGDWSYGGMWEEIHKTYCFLEDAECICP